MTHREKHSMREGQARVGGIKGSLDTRALWRRGLHWATDMEVLSARLFEVLVVADWNVLKELRRGRLLGSKTT